VVTALYRRYRPETFAELIGQSQVTDPLRTALRTDRVNHAYLFSGPRGCGKTTSARILARCLNCVEGPTDTPCGVCPSCVELSRDGSGSLDVVEIDAASHNGVDDARDLRERAVFAPARDRFKIFILDEAHMVTPQGFNALLKIVEEPPEHVKFIFATTEPEKVIGTIRSRTHHYPFRLVPPAQMLEYVQSLCEQEKVSVEAGVLPLVVRAGGGSVRDTLSLLDQLIAGSEGASVLYERAVALLGYTHGALLDDVVDAMGAGDAGGVFGAVDRVIQTGQDPRRFVEDLLERLRDLIIVAATADRASAVMRGMPQDQLDRMSAQAAVFGEAELSRAADVVNAALTEMTGATSPRLHLELMVARILVPASDDSERGALARVERLERRINVAGPVTAGPTAVTPATAAPASPAARESAAAMAAATPSAAQPAAEPAPAEPAPAAQPAAEPAAAEQPVAEQPPIEPTPSGEPAALAEPGSVSLQQIRDAWPEILDIVRDAKMSAWVVLETAQARDLRDGDILTVSFPSDNDVANFKQSGPGATGVSEFLRTAILQVLGLRVKFIAKSDVVREQAPEAQAPPADDGWAVTAIPGAEPAQAPRAAVVKEPVKDDGPERYGESVVREMLGASFIEEQPLRPRVVPTAQGE
jgi:DNA polymerase III subunit gamma/tau